MQFGHGTQSDDVTNRPEALSLSAIVCSVAGLQVHCTLPLYTATLQPPSRQLAPISLLLLLHLHLLLLFLHPLPFSPPLSQPVKFQRSGRDLTSIDFRLQLPVTRSKTRNFSSTSSSVEAEMPKTTGSVHERHFES